MPQDVFPDAGLIPGKDDLEVTPQQLLSLPLFCGANAGKLSRCQGAILLRIFKDADQIICRQDTAGASAYFILSEADVYGLYEYVENKLQAAQAKLEYDQAASRVTENLPSHVQTLLIKHNEYCAKLKFLADTKRRAVLEAAHKANIALAQRCRMSPNDRLRLRASAMEKLDLARKVQDADPELTEHLLAAAEGQDDRPAAAAFRLVLPEVSAASPFTMADGESLVATMYERELFGEMACKNCTPRAADVRSSRPI
jgi:hypothetical protein